MLEVYIDGNCAPKNPGGAASYGVVVYRNGTQLWTKADIVGSGDKMSNNVGEYSGLLAFLEWFDKQPIEEVIIYSDSQLLVNQMNGEWKVKKGLYIPYYQRAMILLLHNARIWRDMISFKWIPREENWEADKLSKDILLAHGVRLEENADEGRTRRYYT